MDWSQLWEWLSDPGTQHTIGWLGGGLVVVIGAAWAAYLHLSRRSASSEKANPERPATIQDVRVTASDGSVAAVAGGHLTINQRDPLVERARSRRKPARDQGPAAFRPSPRRGAGPRPRAA